MSNKIKNSLFCFLFALLAVSNPLSATIEQIESFKQTEETFENLDTEALVVFDVDEVIFTDQDAILKPIGDSLKFQIFNEYYVQAQTQKEKEQVSKILSLPLLLGKKVLTEQLVPQLISSLQKRKIKVVALTSCPTKSFGAIESFEKWRLQHLHSFDIYFENSFSSLNRFFLSELGDQGIPSPVFNKGVLFTEGFSKADVLNAFIKKINLKPSKVVFIDDVFRNLQQMELKLNLEKIPHVGYHYQRVEKMDGNSFVDENVARFQFEYLFKTQKWLNDQEAKEILGS